MWRCLWRHHPVLAVCQEVMVGQGPRGAGTSRNRGPEPQAATTPRILCHPLTPTPPTRHPMGHPHPLTLHIPPSNPHLNPRTRQLTAAESPPNWTTWRPPLQPQCQDSSTHINCRHSIQGKPLLITCTPICIPCSSTNQRGHGVFKWVNSCNICQ